MIIKFKSAVSFYFLIAVVCLMSGSASALTLDSSKIRPWGPQLENEFPGEDPGLAIYKHGDFQLFYLGVGHANRLASPTIKFVDELFSKYAFNVLLIESIPHSSGESPKWFLAEAKKGLNSESILGGEPAWGAIQADKKGIPFFAGEPDHQDIYSYLKKIGYSDLDVIGFYTARQIPQWVREKGETSGLIEQEAPAFILNDCKRLSIQICPNLDEIKDWFMRKNGHQLSIDITNKELDPVHGGKIYTQKIAAAIGDCRDKFTLKVIEGLLRKYQRVAVIYGAGHFITLRKSFDLALGEPQQLKLKDLEAGPKQIKKQ